MRSLIATTITTVRPSVTRSKGPKSPRRDKSDENDNSLRNLIKLRVLLQTLVAGASAKLCGCTAVSGAFLLIHENHGNVAPDLGRARAPARHRTARPLDLVDGPAGEIRLRCTKAEFERLHPAKETEFIAAASGYEGYGYDSGQVDYWPYYGLGGGMGVGPAAR